MRGVRRLSLVLVGFLAALAALPSTIAAQPRPKDGNGERFIVVSGEGSVSATPGFRPGDAWRDDHGKGGARCDGRQRQVGQRASRGHQGRGRLGPPTFKPPACRYLPCSRARRSGQQEAQTIIGYSCERHGDRHRSRHPPPRRPSTRRWKPAPTPCTGSRSAKTMSARSSTRRARSPSPTQDARPRFMLARAASNRPPDGVERGDCRPARCLSQARLRSSRGGGRADADRGRDRTSSP